MLTKHAQAAGFASLADYSIPYVVRLSSPLGKAAVAGLITMPLDVVLTAHLHRTNQICNHVLLCEL